MCRSERGRVTRAVNRTTSAREAPEVQEDALVSAPARRRRGPLFCPAPAFRDACPAGGTHALVARRQVRNVHPLGRLRRARHGERRRRVVSARLARAGGRLREVRSPVQPGQVRCRQVGAHGEGRRHEVHRHYQQAPRWIRHVRQQVDQLGHRGRHAVQARPVAGASG